jgi:hypothetical protein
VIDRASTFADPEIVKMLKSQFVPVAIDQAYQRRQKDAQGEFYRKIAKQGPRKNFNGTTQGFYIATPAGKLLLFNNNRDVPKVRRLMKAKLAEFARSGAKTAQTAAIDAGRPDPRWNPEPPTGGLIVRVRAKVLGGYEETTNRWRRIYQTSLSRDNLWITKREHEALILGKVPAALQRRIARFHLVDNTRGEPPMWRPRDIRSVEMSLKNGRLTGRVKLATADGRRAYDAELLGFVETKDGNVTRFDVVALGKFRGEGPYTRGAPKGDFPLAIAFSLADGKEIGDRVPPQGSRGWLQGYLR